MAETVEYSVRTAHVVAKAQSLAAASTRVQIVDEGQAEPVTVDVPVRVDRQPNSRREELHLAIRDLDSASPVLYAGPARDWDAEPDARPLGAAVVSQAEYWLVAGLLKDPHVLELVALVWWSQRPELPVSASREEIEGSALVRLYVRFQEVLD